jgi:hypothetical protein
MFENLSNVDTSKIAELNRNQFPSDQRSSVEKPRQIAAPTHSMKTNATRVNSVRTAKIDPATKPARK